MVVLVWWYDGMMAIVWFNGCNGISDSSGVMVWW